MSPLLTEKDRDALLDRYQVPLLLLIEACGKDHLENDIRSLVDVDEALYGPIFIRLLQK
jgi:hypothetical protein